MKNQPMNANPLDTTLPLLQIWVDEVQANLTDLQPFAAIEMAVNEIVADIGSEALSFVLEEYGDRFGYLKLGYGGHQKQWKAIEQAINAQGLTIYDMALDSGILLILSRHKAARDSPNRQQPYTPPLSWAQTITPTTSPSAFDYIQEGKSATTSDTTSGNKQSSRGISNIHIDPLTAMILFVPPTQPPIEDTDSYPPDQESLSEGDLEEIDTVEYLRLVVDGLFEEERAHCRRNGLSEEGFSGSERTEGAELENVVVAAVNEFLLHHTNVERNEEVEITGFRQTAMLHETDRKWVPQATRIPRPVRKTTSARTFKHSTVTAQTLGHGIGYKPNRSPATLNGLARARYITEGLWTDIQIWMSEMDKESGYFEEADIFPDIEKGNDDD